MQQYFTSEQIAKMLGNKSVRRVRDLIRKGEFGPTLQYGRRRLVSQDGVDAFIERHTGWANIPNKGRRNVCQKLKV